jgi:dihydroorotase
MKEQAVSLLISGAHIIDPGQGIDQVGDLLVDDGNILRIGSTVTPGDRPERSEPEVKHLDASGLVLCPGFVDLHCHLREPGSEDKETIATGTKAAAIGGFAAVCCMANTEPPLDTPVAVGWVKQKVSTAGTVAVFPIGCITKGRKGEDLADMAGLAEAGVVAFSDDGDPVASSLLMRRAMEHSRDLGLPIIDHCEDKALSGNGIINEGQTSARLKLEGIPAAAEEVAVARDLILAELTRARLHIAHVSTEGSVELIRRAREEGIPVTAEVAPHHLTLTEERIERRPPSKAFDVSAKVNPPLRTMQDVQALISGLRDGVIDAIATDHAPHTLADKNRKLERAAFGISGFETAFGCLMSLVHNGELRLNQLISKLTREAAKVISKTDELGTLKIGAPANITIFDPNREWVVNSPDFASKGKNTPYDGYEFRGKVMATVANGKIAYIDDSLVIARTEVTK